MFSRGFKKLGSGYRVLSELRKAGLEIREPFYHATGYSGGARILSSGFKAKAGGEGNDAYYDNALCFTRNFEYTQEKLFGNSDIIFVLDRAELKTRYKVYPYNYFQIGSIAKSLENMRGKEEASLYLKYQRGIPRRELFKAFLDSKVDLAGLDSLSDGELLERYGSEFKEKVDEFKKLTIKAKGMAAWEFEERVSRTSLLDGTGAETVIPPKYIKAILVYSYRVLENLFKGHMGEWPVVLFYNKAKNIYTVVDELDDVFSKVELGSIEDLSLKNKLDLASASSTSSKPELIKSLILDGNPRVIETLLNHLDLDVWTSEVIGLVIDRADIDLLETIFRSKGGKREVFDLVLDKLLFELGWRLLSGDYIDLICDIVKSPYSSREDVVELLSYFKELDYLAIALSYWPAEYLDLAVDRILELDGFAKGWGIDTQAALRKIIRSKGFNAGMKSKIRRSLDVDGLKEFYEDVVKNGGRGEVIAEILEAFGISVETPLKR